MKKTIELINELKNEGLLKDYAIGGAIGVLKWVEPFFTRDLDIFIIPVTETKEGLINLSPIYEYLKKKGCQWKGQWLIIEGTPVDFIPVDALEREAVENARVTEFEGVETKVITPEYLKERAMEDKRRIIIGNKVMTREELFREKENYHRISAAMPFEEKIKALIELQRIAYSWGGKKDVVIWKLI